MGNINMKKSVFRTDTLLHVWLGKGGEQDIVTRGLKSSFYFPVVIVYFMVKGMCAEGIQSHGFKCTVNV